MARNRQRAKQRRAARMAHGGGSPAPARAGDGAPEDAPAAGDGGATEAPAPGAPPHDTERELFADNPELIGTAPPEDLGRSDATLDAAQETDEADLEEDYDFEDEEQPAPEGWQAEAAGRRGAEREDGRPREKERGRVVTFLINCWAELQRVQWPNRKQVTQLTAIVLGFVVLAGGYLGLLDVIFSELISELI
jgi:preprotein translocase subunit SecE